LIFNAFNIASSSLLAHQRAIGTISHNIANVNTPGYSRQDPVLTSLIAEHPGGIDVGRGIQLQKISRTVDPLLAHAQLKNGSSLAYWNAVKNGLSSVESVFGSLDAPGLGSVTDAFFQSWQQLANDPLNQALRLNVRARANDLTMQVSRMKTGLTDARTGADTKIDASIAKANILLDSIGNLNQQMLHHLASPGNPPNDLLDKRDKAINELSKLLPIQQVNTKSGKILIQTVSGDLLIQNTSVHHLARGPVQPSGFGSIVIASTGRTIQGLEKDGEIGGLLHLRDSILSGYINTLDSFSANLAFGVNQIHASGVGSARTPSIASGQSDAAAIPSTTTLNSLNIPFSSQITTGQFTIYAHDSTGQPITPSGANTISINPATTTLSQIVTDINAAYPGTVTASLDTSNRLTITASGANTVAFGGDTSNFLAAYEINTFFKGSTSADLAVSTTIQTDATQIATGAIDPITSKIMAGDNSIAMAINAMQNTALAIDGSPASTIHERGTGLTNTFGINANIANQQQIYRNSESEALSKQREMISGVNLDEEMITMIKFQRAYEASAKLIQTSNQMLDTLMRLIR